MAKGKKSLEKILALLLSLLKKLGKKQEKSLPVYRLCLSSPLWKTKKPKPSKKDAAKAAEAVMKQESLPFVPYQSRSRRKTEAMENELVYYIMCDQTALCALTETLKKALPNIEMTYEKTAG